MRSQRRWTPLTTRLPLWLLCLWAAWLVGCTKQVKQAPPTTPAKSDQPIARLVKHEGSHVRYDIYNTSGRTFIGFAVVFDADNCDGPRSRHFSVQIDAKPLHKNIRRPLRYRLPYTCKDVKLSAYDLPTFRRKLMKEHRPVTRFTKNGEQIAITIQNRSVIPFRGVAVEIKGFECQGPKSKYIWRIALKRRLYPGHERVERMKLPVPCERVDVDAMDLIMFIKRQAILRQRQRQLRNKLREGAKKLFKGF